MALNFAVTLLAIFHIVNQIGAQTYQSPCPRLFVYESRGAEPDRWYGILTLLSDYDLNGVWLRLMLDRPSLQLGNWFGEVDPREGNKEYLIKNRNHKLKANTPETLRFYIKYNTAEPVPQLIGFRLNAVVKCPEGIATSAPPTEAPQLITSSEQNTTTTRPEVVLPDVPNRPPDSGGTDSFRPPSSSSSEGDDDDDFFHCDFCPGGVRPGLGVKREVECGTVASSLWSRSKRQVSYYYYYPQDDDSHVQQNNGQGQNNYANFYRYISSLVNTLATPQQQVQPRPLITYGEVTREGEFPWHAALYHTRGAGLNYICGGSVISKKHVITVGHCITKPRSDVILNPENLLIYLGKYYLKRWSNTGIQDHQVDRIIRHPNYNPDTFANDIAILKLARQVEYTDYVRPICLWHGPPDSNSIIGKFGTVVGWGFNEKGMLTEALTKIQMPVVSKDTCIYSFADFFSRYTTSETYCAGFQNGTSVCNGDSGGGMIFPKKTNGQHQVWQLRGLVSISVALQNEFKCNPKHYVVFTDVAMYLDFIKAAMAV